MSWRREIDGLHLHEGYVAFLTSGGLSGVTARGGVVLVGGTAAGDVVVPWQQVQGWQTACLCGWTGQRFARATATENPNYPAAAEETVLPDGRTVEDAAYADWCTHIDPLDCLSAITAAAAAVDTARRRLDAAVAKARGGPNPPSWAQIARAARMSRQAAHQRWGQPTRAETASRSGWSLVNAPDQAHG